MIQEIVYNDINSIIESPPQHCSSCLRSVCALLLTCSFCFSLLLVSLFFSFLFFSMANSSILFKFKIVERVNNSDENCRNVCFEGKILNKYGNFDYLYSSNAKKNLGSNIYPYLH